MAKYPYLSRYFLFGGRDETMELLLKLQEEKAGLGRGVPDAIERLKHLANQLNDLDPYYLFDIEARSGEVAVGVRPLLSAPDRWVFEAGRSGGRTQAVHCSSILKLM